MITASQVKELREKTGAGMMDCKKVLTETNGDEEKAIELLRERGIMKYVVIIDKIALWRKLDFLCVYFVKNIL